MDMVIAKMVGNDLIWVSCYAILTLGDPLLSAASPRSEGTASIESAQTDDMDASETQLRWAITSWSEAQ